MADDKNNLSWISFLIVMFSDFEFRASLGTSILLRKLITVSKLLIDQTAKRFKYYDKNTAVCNII